MIETVHVTSYSENKLEINCTWKLLDLKTRPCRKKSTIVIYLDFQENNSLALSNKITQGLQSTIVGFFIFSQ